MNSVSLKEQLNSKFTVVKEINDVLQPSFYVGISDYMALVDSNTDLVGVVEQFDEAILPSVEKIRLIKHIINFKQGDELPKHDFDFAFERQNILDLGKPQTPEYTQKLKARMLPKDYFGHLVRVHYAIIDKLTSNQDVKVEEITKQEKEADVLNVDCKIEWERDGEGYQCLVYNKRSFRIGKPNTRTVKLLRALSDPNLGITKMMNAVFDAISIPKDKKDQELINPKTAKGAEDKKWTIINDTVKEINKKLKKARITFGLSKDKKNKSISMHLNG